MTEEGRIMRVWARATIDSAGYDIKAEEDFSVIPGQDCKVSTSYRFTDDMDVRVRVAIPSSISYVTDYNSKHVQWYNAELRLNTWYGMIVPRSGMGFKYGLRLKNTTGIIDQGYRDPIQFVLQADTLCEVKKGERFAQLIFQPFGILAGEPEPTKERNGGLGSTGK